MLQLLLAIYVYVCTCTLCGGFACFPSRSREGCRFRFWTKWDQLFVFVLHIRGVFFSFSCCNCVIRCMYVLALAVDGVNCFVLSQRNAPNASPETDEQTDRPSAIHSYTDYILHTTSLLSFLPFSSLFSPSPHPLSHTPPHPLLLLPTLYLSCPLSRKSRSPLFLLNRQIIPFFFLSSFRAVRYWARQLGNRRHFRTVPAQPTHVCPHISSTHPPSIHPSNPFFFLSTLQLFLLSSSTPIKPFSWFFILFLLSPSCN